MSAPPVDMAAHHLVGHTTEWDPLDAGEWRARRILEVSGLTQDPYDPSRDRCLLPPTYLVAQSLGFDRLGIPNAPSQLNGGNRCRWLRPVVVGTPLERRCTISAVRTKTGRSGQLVFYDVETHVRDARAGDVVAETSSTAIRRYPPTTPAPTTPASATPADGRPSRDGADRTSGGERPAELDTARAVFSVTPTTRDLVRYAAGTDDYYEAHYDLAFAKERGFPGVIVHGLLKLAWLARGAAEYFGPGTVVETIEGSYRGVDLVAQPFEVWAAPEGDERRDETARSGSRALQLFGVSSGGAIGTVGRAVVRPQA